MIDWRSIVFNGFWICGLSVLLAAFSYHYWAAQHSGNPLRLQLQTAGFVRFFWFGLALISVGLAGTSSRPWEVAIWLLFVLLSLWNALRPAAA